MLIRIVKLTIQKERIPEFLVTFDRVRDQIKNFPGCENLDLLRDVSNEEIYFTSSIWTSEQNLEEYRRSDLFVSSWATVKSMFSAKASAWSLNKVDEFK